MKKYIILTALLLTCVFLTGTANAADDLTTKIKKADDLFYQAESVAYEEAGKIYEELLKKYPDNYEVLWKTARFYEKVARFTKDPLAIFEKGKALAERAITLYPDKVEGHYWNASLIGRVGEEKGILNSLFMVKPMKAELDRCFEIDPTFPDAYWVMSLLYWKVPGWPVSIGDKKLAVEYALKATQLKPESFLFQWGLYEAYDAAGKKKEAKEVLQKIITMKVAPGHEKEAVQYKKQAQDALK